MYKLFFVIALISTLPTISYCQTAADTVIHNYLEQFEPPSFSSYKLTYESLPVIKKVDFYKNKLEEKRLVHQYYKQTDQGEIFRTEYYRNNEPGLVGIVTKEEEIYFDKKNGFYHKKEKTENEKNLIGSKLSSFHVSKLISQAFRANKLEFVNEEHIEGKTCIKFKYHTDNKDKVYYFYFDKFSNELYGLIFSKRNYEIYENYKQVNGLVIPTLVTGFLDNEEYYIFNYTNLELDIDLLDVMLLEEEEGIK